MSEQKKYQTLAFLGYPLYRVGRDGSFWRYTQVRGWTRRKVNPQGGVGVCHKGKKKSYRLGHLVLQAFVGPPPPGMECCHSPDPNPKNNNLSNLRWGTHTENMKDKREHGRETNAKINLEIAEEIRRKYATGKYTMVALGEKYGIAVGTIHPIIHYRTWRPYK